MPLLARLRPSLEARGARLIGISVDDDVATARAFAASHQLPFESYFGGRELADSLAAGKLPTTLFVNDKGVVVETLRGMLSEDRLLAEVDAILGPPGSGAIPTTRS
jgi:hypothetical protein